MSIASANTVVVLDFETTGLSPGQGDRAIEIGAVRIKDGYISERFSALMNPGFNAGRDYTFCEQFASVVTPKNISIRKSSLQQAHLIFRRLLIDFG